MKRMKTKISKIKFQEFLKKYPEESLFAIYRVVSDEEMAEWEEMIILERYRDYY